MGVREQHKKDWGNRIQGYTPQEIRTAMYSLETKNIIRDRALIATLYLTGNRISETLPYYRLVTPTEQEIRTAKEFLGIDLKGKPTKELIAPGLKKKQIHFYKDRIVFENVRVLKRIKGVNEPENARKPIPIKEIPIVFNEKDTPFINALVDYLDHLKMDDELFPISRQRANQILATVDLFPHGLRHSRVTFMIKYHDFNSYEIQRYFGWATIETSQTYAHLMNKDLINKQRRTLNNDR